MPAAKLGLLLGFEFRFGLVRMRASQALDRAPLGLAGHRQRGRGVSAHALTGWQHPSRLAHLCGVRPSGSAQSASAARLAARLAAAVGAAPRCPPDCGRRACASDARAPPARAAAAVQGVATPRASSPPPISHTAPGCSDGTGASSGLSKPGGRGERVAGATSLSAQASLPLPLPLQAARPERHAPARGRLRSGGPIRTPAVSERARAQVRPSSASVCSRVTNPLVISPHSRMPSRLTLPLLAVMRRRRALGSTSCVTSTARRAESCESLSEGASPPSPC